jgi:hypothetical protein
MPDYSPQFVFPFAVNGLLTVMSIIVILYGRRIHYVLRLVTSFFVIAILMILLPLAP